MLKIIVNQPFPLDPALAAPPTLDLNPPFFNVSAIDPNLKLPYVYQWNVAIEQSLGANQTATASYVAAVGRRLLRTEFLTSANADFINTFFTSNAATSDYHAMQLQFQRRLSRGLQTLISYTWSKSLDTASDDSSLNAPLGRINLQLERGPSNFDVRHSLVAAVTYNIPAPSIGAIGNSLLRDWSVDTILRAHSATPVNVNLGSDVLGVGRPDASRPDLIEGVSLYIDDPTVAGGTRINRAAFVRPTTSRQGTLGRNALRGFPLY